MNDLENKRAIETAISGFTGKPLYESSRHLFATLGYQSDRTIPIASVTAFCEQFDPENRLNHSSAYKDQWKSIHLLFQITDEELSSNTSLFKDTSIKSSLLQSYVFFAIELNGNDYARGKLASITRQLNRIFPMPVMALFKMVDKITIAVINRRQHKRDESKDVLGKVTLIQNISLNRPHPGHLDILASFSTHELTTRKKPIGNFDQLHAAWEEVFDVELLNKRFYEELSNWYFWARRNVSFPADLEPDEEKRNSTSVIRLLTRIIFCWFLKEKGLIPENLFNKDEIASALVSLDNDESTYYRAILQNLFFATLNQQMNAKGKTHRQFADDESFAKNRAQYGIKNLYRYKDTFCDTIKALALFEDIPFLNGGLFACLDIEDDNGKARYGDGFSRNQKKQPIVPNYLFFAEPQTIDLSADYGEAKKKKESVRGLLHILKNYKFTIAENTPVEQEIALDPELLGKVFENLLASYNQETGTTARKQTGSFYTPRPIVDYMVDESLKEYLAHVMEQKLPETTVADAKAGLDILFAYTEREHAFSESEIDVLIAAIDACNILDPACGSGAFPMGILHKLVFILGKLDPNNEKWRNRQIAKAEEIEDVEARESAVKAIERDFAENALDYGRKLYLIENCIYGVDIQPIAIQISKLRFFISLVCDQKTNRDKSKNHGIRPLPNLETKFVAADSLISLKREFYRELFANPKVELLEKELEKIRHRYFSAQTRQQKLSLKQKDAELCRKILSELKQASFADEDASIKIASWNPYDHYAAADFFDPAWMFGRSLANGFDVVIGNPPYIQIQSFSGQPQQKAWEKQGYDTYAKTGDVYCLFYERGFNLLSTNGVLAYITSNKWMRAGYGKAMRKYFLKNGKIRQLIDFGDSPIFENATTYTDIMVWRKEEARQAIHVWDLSKAYSADISLEALLEKEGNCEPLFNEDSFVIARGAQSRIKQRIEAVGVPLKKWDIQINRGILTGLNEAFIISGAKKDELIAQNPKSAEIIKPILRGRDIKRYKAEFADLWLINPHNGYGNVPRIDTQKDFPAIWEHLQRINRETNGGVEKRQDQGSHWTNLRNCAYLPECEKEKIVFAEIVFDSAFYFDTKKYYPEATAFIMTGEGLKYLIALLNSNLLTYVFRTFYAGGDLRGNTFRYKKVFLENLPIPKLDALTQLPFEILVDCVLFAHDKGLRSEASTLEWVINIMVYGLYFEAEMKKDDCYINDRVVEVVKPFKPDDADEFKSEYVKKLAEFFLKDKIIYHGLIHSRNVEPVRIIHGEKK